MTTAQELLARARIYQTQMPAQDVVGLRVYVTVLLARIQEMQDKDREVQEKLENAMKTLSGGENLFESPAEAEKKAEDQNQKVRERSDALLEEVNKLKKIEPGVRGELRALLFNFKAAVYDRNRLRPARAKVYAELDETVSLLRRG